MRYRTARLVAGSVAAVAAAALIASCSGSSDESSDASTTTTAASTAASRPEGEWNLVRWQSERTGAQLGDAVITVADITPACDEGPCDLKLTPAGAQGTYRPEGYPLEDPVEPGQELTYTWDEATNSYFNVNKTTEDCTTADGEVPDGYEVIRTTRVQFEPEKGDTPASLHGTVEEAATGTPDGVAKGCTDYSATWSVAGAPVGSFDGDDGAARELADSYVVTEIVEATEPAGSRPKGFRGILADDAKVTLDGDSAQLVGTLGTPAALSFADGRWSGSATSDTVRCSDGDGPGEYDSTEEWTDLRAVAVTQDGNPVLVGRWTQTATPNAAGVAANCAKGSNTGFVILVPTSAVTGSGSGSTTTTAPGGSAGSSTTQPGHSTGHG